MAYYTLTDNSTTLNLDDNFVLIDIEGISRRYEIVQNLMSSKATVKGIGKYEPKKITIARSERTDSSSNHFWNAARKTIIGWITKEIPIYFGLVTGETSGSVTTKTRVYPIGTGNTVFTNLRKSNQYNFEFILPTGYLEKSTATTGSQAISDGSQATVSITNASMIPCPVQVKFTPSSANQSLFSVYNSNGKGFLLSRQYFPNGVQTIVDTSDGTITIGGSEYNIASVLQRGGMFELLPGSNTLYVQFSGAGTFAWEYTERYV